MPGLREGEHLLDGRNRASIDDVRIMKEEVGEEAQIKAAGGIGDWQKAAAMVEEGASRIGASAGLQILRRSIAGGNGY